MENNTVFNGNKIPCADQGLGCAQGVVRKIGPKSCALQAAQGFCLVQATAFRAAQGFWPCAEICFVEFLFR